MKSNLHLQGLAAVFLLVVSLGAAPAQKGSGSRPAVDPNTGLPLPNARSLPAIDPVTGLPMQPALPAAPEWKDPDWKEPNITLTHVFYDGLPVEEVARHLREQFNNAFDVLIPNGWQDPKGSVEPINPQIKAINLQLRNVTASEVFNAMNLMFEAENAPLRWELKMNGKRPAAVLRVMPELLPRAAISSQPLFDPTTGLPLREPLPGEIKRTIQFVGDLIGDDKTAGMTMEQIVKTISEVWKMTYGQPGVVQFHKEAHLLVVSGTPEQIDFVQQVVRELRTKVELERKSGPKPAEPKPKSEPKPGSPAGSK